MKKTILLISLLLGVFSLSFSDDMQAAFDKYGQYAKGQAETIYAGKDFKEKNAEASIDDIAGDNVSELHNPKEKKYYSDDTKMTSDSYKKYSSSESTTSIEKAYEKTPNNDPDSDINKHLHGVMEDSEAITNGDSSRYECVEKPESCTEETQERHITVKKNTKLVCVETPNVNFPHEDDKPNVEWSNSCSNIPSDFKELDPRRCTVAGSTKLVSGKEVKLPCWEYQTVYGLGKDKITDETTSIPKNCTVVDSSCLSGSSGICAIQDLTISCTTKKCSKSQIKCGEPNFCSDGSCFTPDEKPADADKFYENVSTVAAVANSTSDIEDKSKDLIQFNRGQAKSCGIAIAGLYNCCKYKNSFLHHCSTEEMEIDEAKKKGVAIDLGIYCSKRFLGICLEHKGRYCIFHDKLSRIIQEQGKPQLGLNLGSAKYPDCRGFYRGEFENIDFDRIDFSEFYKDIDDANAIPDSEELQKLIDERMKGRT